MIRQIILTLVVLVATILFFQYNQFDLLLQDYFYNFSSSSWIVDRNEPLARLLFYDGIKAVYLLFILCLLMALLVFWHNSHIKPMRRGLIIVCLSTILVPVSVGILKSTTNVPCPKNIQRYGGNDPYVTLLSARPKPSEQNIKRRCYPAGHASGGFALMSLYFLFSTRRSRHTAVLSAVTIGWVIGSYKMMIGDHFFSHTVVAMIIARLIILLIATLLPQKQSGGY